ncbi:MAG: 50S ribosomal protein L4 [Candidatus Bathyarchaeia archaeon]
MRRVKVYGLDGKALRTIRLPSVFNTPVRYDLIRRAVVAQQSHGFQPKGRDPMAGKRTTAESYGVGHGLARVPRVKGERHPRSGQAAFAPGTVGGRLAHPPSPLKRIGKKINRKERLLALKAAIAATADKELVGLRGHLFNVKRGLPIVVSDEFEGLSKAEEAVETLEKLGVREDLERVKGSIKERAGKGKMRGRRLKKAVGPLIVIAEDRGVSKAVRNIPGVDVVRVYSLSVEDLAPGTHPGRLTVWSESALKALDEIFMEEVKAIA